MVVAVNGGLKLDIRKKTLTIGVGLVSTLHQPYINPTPMTYQRLFIINIIIIYSASSFTRCRA